EQAEADDTPQDPLQELDPLPLLRRRGWCLLLLSFLVRSGRGGRGGFALIEKKQAGERHRQDEPLPEQPRSVHTVWPARPVVGGRLEQETVPDRSAFRLRERREQEHADEECEAPPDRQLLRAAHGSSFSEVMAKSRARTCGRQRDRPAGAACTG